METVVSQVIAGLVNGIKPALPYIMCLLSIILCMSAERTGKKQQKKAQLMEEGMKCMLRQNIIDTYNKYDARGEMPIYAKESANEMYDAYHALGGNGIITDLYLKMLEMEDKNESSVKAVKG